MPNWVYNDLTVSGPAEDVARFQNQAKEAAPRKRTKPPPPAPVVFSFQNLLPIPPRGSGNVAPETVRDWCLRHWGCRSGALRTRLVGDTGAGCLLYEFATPWSPPVPFIRELSERWPTLVFILSYEEWFIGFRGLACAVAGRLQHSHRNH